MRSHDKPLAENEVVALFAYDLPTGEVCVSCSECGAETDSDKDPGTDEVCSGCYKFFVYRPWYEW